MDITQPAIAMLQRLRFSQKFAFIGLIAVIPIGLLTYFFNTEVNTGASFASGERVGLAVLHPTYDLMADLARLRTATTRQADLAKSQEAIKNDVQAISKLNSGSAASLKLGQDLKNAVDLSNKAAAKGTTADIDAALDAVNTLIGTIGNNSQLVLDPDIDSYYTMDTGVVQVESILVKLAPARDLMSEILAKGKTISPADRTKLTVLQTQIDTPMGTIDSDLKQAKAFNKTVGLAVDGPKDALAKASQTFDAVLKKGFVEGDRITVSPTDVKQAGDEFQKNLDAYFGAGSKTLDQLLAVREGRYIHRRNAVLAVVATCLMLTVYLFIALYRSIRRSVGQISSQLFLLKDHSMKEFGDAMKALSNGDLTVEVTAHDSKLPESSRDEIGDMVRTFNEMTEITAESIEAYNVARVAVAEVISQIVRNTGTVTDRSHRLSESASAYSIASKEIAEGSEKLAVHATETAAIMEQLAAQVSTVKGSSEHQQVLVTEAAQSLAEADSGIVGVISSVKDMSQAASEGNNAVTETMSMMRRLQERVDDSATKVGLLAEKSKEIDLIVQSIKDIADQTNLLALNAAIEAARAGESGRGFAVVADEVRKLAEQTGSQTKEINALIQAISHMIADAVSAIESTTVEVKQGFSRTEFAASTLEQIMDTSTEVAHRSEMLAKLTVSTSKSMSKVAASAGDNASASHEMAIAANRVAASITDVAAVSEEAAAGAEELTSTIHEVTNVAKTLTEMSSSLDLLLSKFQVEDEKPDLKAAA